LWASAENCGMQFQLLRKAEGVKVSDTTKMSKDFAAGGKKIPIEDKKYRNFFLIS